MSKLEKGQVLEGVVKNPENYVQPSQHGGYQVGPAWNPTNPESPVTLSDFFNIGQQ